MSAVTSAIVDLLSDENSREDLKKIVIEVLKKSVELKNDSELSAAIKEFTDEIVSPICKEIEKSEEAKFKNRIERTKTLAIELRISHVEAAAIIGLWSAERKEALDKLWKQIKDLQK